MKKFTLICVALLLALTGCTNKTDKEKIANYQADLKQFTEAYSAQLEKIDQNQKLTDEEKLEAMQAYDEKATKQLVEKASSFIKNNSSSPIAITALQDVYYQMDLDKLEAVLSCLEGDNLKDQFVLKLQAGLVSKKATAEGKMFADFTIVQDPSDPQASTIKFSDYVGKGKYILVDFWASWCGPCKEEIPNIAAIYDKYKGDDFDVLSVAVWDKPEDTKLAAAKLGVIWNQIINAQNIPTDIYGIDGIPHIMLVGPDGLIVSRNLRGKAIETAVSKALGR